MELRIRCLELFSHLTDEDVLVIDCRHPFAWDHEARHIPGALRMTLEEVLGDAASLPDDELIILCDGGQSSLECIRVCYLLRTRGKNAVCLEGGLSLWLESGLPTEGHGSSRHSDSAHA